MVSGRRWTRFPRSASQALVSVTGRTFFNLSQMSAHWGWLPGRSSSHRLVRPIPSGSRQFESNRQTGDKFRIRVAQVIDGIVRVVLQMAASGNAPLQRSGFRFENSGCFPIALKKYLNVATHGSH